MLNITHDMQERQGLNPHKWYEARVVENDDRKHPDKMMLGRIQARINEIFEGIPDKDLPWAVPLFEHPDGASEITGTFSVPKKGTKVFLRFQDGNPSFPMYRGFHVDKVTQMEEIKYNYPNRTVTRFSNKALMVLDTQDNVLYLRNPGTVKIYVEGNVEMEVKGNVDELIRGSYRRTIMGNFHDTVFGLRHILTGMAKVETTLGLVHEFSSGRKTVESSGGEVHIEGSKIYENSSKSLGVPVPPVLAKMSKWPGIPGGAMGTNRRKPLAAKDAVGPATEMPPEPAVRTATPDIASHMPPDVQISSGGVLSGDLTPDQGGSTQLPENTSIPGHFGTTDSGNPNKEYITNAYQDFPMAG